MARYQVLLELKATAAQEPETVQVWYEAADYKEAWPGARTVCRLGTLFKDDPKCKSPRMAREFWVEGEDGPERYEISPATHIVRRIFVENSRKTGKQRMTTLSKDQLIEVLKEQKVPVSQKLAHALDEVFKDSEGLRITVAAATRLGLALAAEAGNDEG